MQSEGLVHVAKQIFDYVNTETLMQCVNVNSTWNGFFEKYGRKRFVAKLDSVLAPVFKCDKYLFNNYDALYDYDKECPKTFLEVFDCSNWKKQINYMKTEANISDLVKFIGKMGKNKVL